MALNAYTGTNTAPVSTAGKKRGGGGKKKRGLYQGKAGAAASNQDPLTFFQTAGRKAGISTGAGTGFDTWYNDFMAPRMVGDYNAALANNEHLSARKWLNKTYDVSGWGKKKTGFDAGQLSATGGPLADQYDVWSANQNPLTRVATEGRLSGDIAGNGNQQYQDWYVQNWAPQMEAEWATSQRTNPTINFRDFLGGQDPERARRAFANRAPQYRQPTAFAPTGGRWSWWS